MLVHCYPTVSIETQIEILKAVRFLIQQPEPSSTQDNSNVKQELMSFLLNEFFLLYEIPSSMPSSSLLFHKQEEFIFLLRLLLTSSSWNSSLLPLLHSSLNSIHSLSYSHMLALSSLFGGELIGLFNGCKGKYIPKKIEINEKTAIHEIYEKSENCQVLEIDKDTVKIQIDRTKG